MASKRDRLAKALSQLTPDQDSVEEIETLAEEFRSWADNMPENMNSGDKHEQVEAAADALDELVELLNDITDKVSKAEGLEW